MTGSPAIADIARLIGDPTRTQILLALGGGRALPAGELAASAGVMPRTVSAHLADMRRAGLLIDIRQGRHHYFRIASPEVADMLESMRVVAAGNHRSARLRVDPALRFARTCYKHLAGRLGVALCDAMQNRRQVELADGAALITAAGLDFLERLGVDLKAARKHRHTRACIDWSERREHLGGPVGVALHRRLLELGWVRNHPDTRAITVTRAGAKGLRDVFGVDTVDIP